MNREQNERTKIIDETEIKFNSLELLRIVTFPLFARRFHIVVLL